MDAVTPALLTRLGRRAGRLRRRVLLHRRGLAAGAAAVAAYAGVHAATAPPPPTVAVWTAARDLPLGRVLAATDLRRVAFTPQSVPSGVLTSPGAVLGRTLATPLTRGQPVTTGQVVATGWLSGRPGLTAVPVRLTDPGVVALLHPGDKVRLVAADPQAPGVARPLTAATVLTVPHASDAASSAALPGRLVLLGVPPGAAEDVAGASASAFLTVLWDR